MSIKSKDPTVMNNILASELRHLMNEKLLVVFDEVPIAGSNSLHSVIENMRSLNNIDVGLSLVNANTWLGNDEEVYDKNSMIIYRRNWVTGILISSRILSAHICIII